MAGPVTVLWFKRDLRVQDHPALTCVTGPVIPLYIAEPEMWAQPDASARQWDFVSECLTELREDLRALGAPLLIRVGEATSVLEALRQVTPIHRLISHEETGLRWSWDRDKRVAAWARHHDVAWDQVPADGVIRRLQSRDGWAAKRERFMRQPQRDRPAKLHGPVLDPGPLPDATVLGLSPDPCPERQPGGRRQALGLLGSFLTDRGRTYRSDMSSPLAGEWACSRLSAHLAWGTLSPREAQQAAMARMTEVKGTRDGWTGSLRSFISRLAWRDHFTQKLEDFPDLDRKPMHPAFADLRPTVAEDPTAARHLEAWAQGQTGIPFVDACMRSARATGWLNFRMRAMVQCVASYHLWIDWRDSAPVLARLWTDYAPGIHYSQAQMQSGVTGINTLRIYNPIKQGKDQDPDGIFTRRWVPEIAHLPDATLQEPWTADTPVDYPAPLVDVAEAARLARDRVYAHRRTPGFREAADEVAAKHGSRKSGMAQTGRRKRAKDTRQQEMDL
ncbi:MAG: FAD-binding domain-containing protein [Pseudomonadota bacterium]